MPRLSLYRPNRTRDYQFLDRTISEMYTVGGLDIYVHKYMGPVTGGEDSAFLLRHFPRPRPQSAVLLPHRHVHRRHALLHG